MVERYAQFGAEVKNLKTVLPDLLQRVEELHEFNPMLGHRGCRLGITYPEITEMQARAIFEAVVQVAKKGKKVIPEVMIPLIGGVKELEDQKAIVKRVADEVLAKAGLKDQQYMIGTMIEIPRAALTADQVATEAEFFSFGTNDLTQTTMGLSRDDYTKFSKDYEDKKIFKADPFAVLDQEGVGQADQDGRREGPQDQSGPRNRHLRRARRRAELGGVLLPRRHGLRVLLPVPCADRAPGRRSGRHHQGRQERSDADSVVIDSNSVTKGAASAAPFFGSERRPERRSPPPRGRYRLWRAILQVRSLRRTAHPRPRPAITRDRLAGSGIPVTSSTVQVNGLVI